MKAFVLRFLSAMLLAALLLAGQGVRPAYAATITVNTTDDELNSDGDCSLREAIQAANTDTAVDACTAGIGSDTIIVPAGTYTLTITGTGEDANATGDLDITSNITITGAGAGITIIQAGATPGSGIDRVFHVTGSVSVNVVLQNLTIANGRAIQGGGVNNGGTLTITGSTFSGNIASSFYGYGGGVYNGGALTITDSTFSGNSAGGYYGYGGGVNNGGTLTITNSTFSGNSAGGFYGYGGGVSNDGTLAITNSTFSGNSVGGYGGAYSSGGGGVYNSGGTLTITNSTFSGNSARSGGGVRGGGGIYVNSGTVTLKNTIIANSTSGGDCVGALSGSNLNNLIEDTGTDACGLAHSFNGNIIGFDPDLGTLTGSPQYFPLNPGSLAIDAGTNNGCPADSQNGVTRPQDGDGNSSAICDIGSYEAPLPLLVSAHSLQTVYTDTGPAAFTVTYNQAVADPLGNSGADDVTNPANYLLIEKGGNAIADTASCAGGVGGDDTQQTVTAVSYNASTFTATVTLAGALPIGNYRLFVCGTTSIVSLDDTPLNNGADFTFDFRVQPQTTRLPATGFPMGRITELGAPSVSYSSTDLILEIPSLGVKAPIVGVLKSGDGWDVTWLGNSVGWLEGSAFPTWKGNTVLTGHVWDADNTPGVFAKIKDLKYGDRFTIHAFGLKYVYEVRENTWLWGSSRVDKVFKHEELDWVTLLTCEGYNSVTGNYLFRRLVRAVLVEVK